MPAQVTDSLAGTFTATYDLDGYPVTETWPNGVAVERTYNEVGDPSSLTYTLPGCPTSDCTLYSETVQRGVHNQWLARSSTLSGQDTSYDDAGRLTQVRETVDAQCTVRAYTFDASANRTGITAFNAGSGGACQTTTPAGATTWSYDTADRVTGGGGYTFDALGRTLTMPGGDTATPSGGTATMTYHVNDMIRAIQQGTRTTTYTLDVAVNRIRAWTDNLDGPVVTRTNHYTDDDDSPAWTDEGGGSISRILTGLVGMAGTQDSTSDRTWAITNMHGDIVAGLNEGDTSIVYTSEYGEYGAPREGGAAGVKRYGWLGAFQRAADAPGGFVIMGRRVYNPGTGAFLSVDPIYGGGCSSYGYVCGDPVSQSDLSGECVIYDETRPRECGGVTNSQNIERRDCKYMASHLSSRGYAKRTRNTCRKYGIELPPWPPVKSSRVCKAVNGFWLWLGGGLIAFGAKWSTRFLPGVGWVIWSVQGYCFLERRPHE